jgi:hypothetical protein
LQALTDEAKKQGLRLGITYQGLDFARDPLPIARVQADLEYFEQTFARQEPFELFGKPLVVWSGTWDFSKDEIRSVTSALRPRVLVLASEKNERGYSRVAADVDGNAYYWSSVNPDGIAPAKKLDSMGALVHRTGGLWIAPVAPGYDGTLLGGTRVINRDGAGTLEAQWNMSMRSSPDAIGVISWNEFSENTHVEPSEKYGRTALDTLARLAGAQGPTGEIDSSSPPGRSASPFGVAAIVFLVALLGGSVLLIRRRSRAGTIDS